MGNSENIEAKPEATKTVPKLDRDLTVDFVLDRITEYYPSLSSENDFLLQNRKHVDKLTTSQKINNEMVKYSLKICPNCPDSHLTDWPFKAKTAYFISMGRLKEIQIPVKLCDKCRRAYYPQGNININHYLISN